MAKRQVIRVVYQIEDERGNVVAESQVRGAYVLDAKYDPSPTMQLAAEMAEAQASAYIDPIVQKVAELEQVVARLEAATDKMHRALYGDGSKVAA